MLSTKKVINEFRTGLNCAQSVVSAFSEELNIDKNILQGITCGFGAGMGKLQKTCGPVTGSFMVISLYNSSKFNDNKTKKEKSEKMIQNFYSEFKEKHGSSCCKSLLDCDLNTSDGKKYANDNKLFETVCEQCILSSVQILQKLLKISLN